MIGLWDDTKSSGLNDERTNESEAHLEAVKQEEEPANTVTNLAEYQHTNDKNSKENTQI